MSVVGKESKTTWHFYPVSLCCHIKTLTWTDSWWYKDIMLFSETHLSPCRLCSGVCPRASRAAECKVLNQDKGRRRVLLHAFYLNSPPHHKNHCFYNNTLAVKWDRSVTLRIFHWLWTRSQILDCLQLCCVIATLTHECLSTGNTSTCELYTGSSAFTGRW